MAMNMMGLGFAFGAKDKGLGKMVDKTTKGIGAISGLVKGVGRSAGKFSLRSMFDVPSQAISTMQSIASDTRVTTTMLEAFGVQASKSSRMAIVGLNLTSKEARNARREIASTAFSMNVDVGSIAQSWKALKQAQVDVTKIGFKSFKQYSKFLSMTGTDSKEFASAMGFMKNTLGMVPAEMEDLIQTTLVLGKKLDMGAEAVPAMIKNMRAMREVGASLFKQWGKDKTAKFLHSTTLVAGAFMKAGHSADQAASLSQNLLKTLMKGRAGFDALYTGMGTDLGDFAKVMSENLMGPQQALAALEKSPTEFISFMNKALTQVDKVAEDQVKRSMGITDASKLSGKALTKYNEDVLATQDKLTKRFTQQMAQHLGPESTDLIMKGFGATGKMIGELEGKYDELGGKKGAIAGVSKEYRDGRTAAERFAIAQDRLVTSMKKLKGVMGDTEFLKAYNKSSGLVLGKMKEMADEGGPVAGAMAMMIDFSNFGLGGVLAKLHPMGLGLTTIIQRFAPLMQVLPGITIAIKAMLNPFTLLIAAIGGIYLVLKYPEKAKKAFKQFSEAIEKNLPKIIDTVKSVAKGIAKAVAKVFTYIWEHIEWSAVLGALETAAIKIGEFLKGVLLKVLDAAEWLITAFGNIDWDFIRKYLTIGFKYAFGAIVLAIGWVMKQLPSLLKGAFKIIYAIIFSFFDGIRDAFKEQFPKWSAFFDVFFGAIKYGFTAVTSFIAARWLMVQAVAVKTAIFAWGKRVVIYAKDLAWSVKLYAIKLKYHLSAMGWAIQDAAAFVKTHTIKMGKWALEKAVLAKNFVWQKAKILGNYALDIAGAIKAAAVKIAQAVRSTVVFLAQTALKVAASYALYAGMILSATVWAAFSIAKYIAVGVAAAASFLGMKIAALAMWAAAFAPITAIVVAIAAIGLAIFLVVKKFDKIVGFFKKIGKKIWGVFKWIGGKIKDALLAPIKLVQWGWGKLKGIASGLWSGIKGIFSSGGDSTSSSWLKKVKNMQTETATSAKGIAASVEAAAKEATGKIETMSDDAKKAAKGVVPVVAESAGLAATETVRANKATMGIVGDFVKTTEGHIKKAKELTFGVMRGDALAEVEKYTQAYNEIQTLGAKIGQFKIEKGDSLEAQMRGERFVKTITKGEHKAHKERKKMLQDQNKEAEAESRRTGKIAVDVAHGFVQEARQAYVTDASMFANMTFEQAKQWKRRASDQKDFYARSRLALGEKIYSDQANQGQYYAELKILDAKMLKDKNIMWAKIEAANSDLSGKIIAGQNLTEAELGIATDVMIGHWAGVSEKIKTDWADKGPISEEIVSGLKAIDAAHAGAMVDIKRDSTLTAAARIAKIQEVTAEHEAQRNKIVGFIAKNQEEIRTGGEAVQADMLKRIKVVTGEVSDALAKSAKESASKIKTTVKEEFKISGTEAAGFLRDLAGIRPGQFKKDLKSLRISFENFLKKLEKAATTLITRTNRKLKTHRKTFDDYWKSIEKATKDYTKKIQDTVMNFWKALIGFATGGTAMMAATAQGLISVLEAKFEKINLLDILTSGGKIYDWALRVVRSLQSAFAGRNPFDSAISIAARNAEAIIDSMAKKRESGGTITPIKSMTHQRLASESARSQAKNDLIGATHAPFWSKKVIAQNEQTNRILARGFKAMVMMQGNKAQRAKALDNVATLSNQGDGMTTR